MPSTEALKVAVQEAIDRRGQELIEVATTILHHPEPGFREQKTSQLVARKFREFGIAFQEGIALTGLKGMLETGNTGPTVAVMGELDSLKVLDHPHADPTTAAAHACGHHCQIAMMLAVGIGLKDAGVLPASGGASGTAGRAGRGIHRDRLSRSTAARGEIRISWRQAGVYPSGRP